MSRGCNSSLHVRDIYHTVEIETHAVKLPENANTNIAQMSIFMSLINHASEDGQFCVYCHKSYIVVVNSTFHCITMKAIISYWFVNKVKQKSADTRIALQANLCRCSAVCHPGLVACIFLLALLIIRPCVTFNCKPCSLKDTCLSIIQTA